MKLKRGELIGYNGCLGYVYDKESKQISVNYEKDSVIVEDGIQEFLNLKKIKNTNHLPSGRLLVKFYHI